MFGDPSPLLKHGFACARPALGANGSASLGHPFRALRADRDGAPHGAPGRTTRLARYFARLRRRNNHRNRGAVRRRQDNADRATEWTDKPAKGAVFVAGAGRLDGAVALKEARRITATIFQDHALIGRLSAIENVLLGLADTRHPLSLLPWPERLRERAALALQEVGLLERATVRTDKLSGGERQRVGIARALVRRPRLLLGDEPFASVDPALAMRLGEEFRRLVVASGLTVVLVLHQLHLARTLADRVVGLRAGRVAFDGLAAAFSADEEKQIFGP